MRLKINPSSKLDVGFGPWRSRELGPRPDELFVRADREGEGKKRPAYAHFEPRSTFTPTTCITTGQAPHGAWYPAHMARESLKIVENFKKIQFALDVRDSRAPLSTGNYFMTNKIPEQLERIVVLNKCDLVDRDYLKRTLKLFAMHQVTCIPVCAENGQNISLIKNYVEERHTIARFKSVGTWMMVFGIPNVGKSKIINALKNVAHTENYKTRVFKKIRIGRARTTSSPEPGTTQHCGNFHIQTNSYGKLYCIDSPGIMLPQLTNFTTTLNMGALGCLPDRIMGEIYIADYMLYLLNSKQMFRYVGVLRLDGPLNDIVAICDHVAEQLQITKQTQELDTTSGI